MNKLLLTLSLATITASLHGMELQEKQNYMAMLSPEVKVCIISALNSFNELDDIINTIKATSLTSIELNEIINDMYGNQKGFKALMHALTNKFSYLQTDYLASQFKTPAAQKYLELGHSLLGWASITSSWITGYEDDMSYAVDQATQLINESADVNFGRGGPLKMTLTHGWNPKLAKLLLDAGAKPELALHTAQMETAFYKTGERGKRIQAIRQLIEDTIKNNTIK